jgi:hypothetical protein
MICHDSLRQTTVRDTVMAQTREKFATQVNSELAAALRSVAQSEGRQLQALVDEAIADLIEKHRRAKPRAHVIGAYLASHEKFAPLYKKLAK